MRRVFDLLDNQSDYITYLYWFTGIIIRYYSPQNSDHYLQQYYYDHYL